MKKTKCDTKLDLKITWNNNKWTETKNDEYIHALRK